MAVTVRKHPLRVEPWAIKMESYLLLLRKNELVEFWSATGRSVSSVRQKPVEKIRQAILDLPRDMLATVLRMRIPKS